MVRGTASLRETEEKQQTRLHSYTDRPFTRERVPYWQLHKKNHVWRPCCQPQPWSKASRKFIFKGSRLLRVERQSEAVQVPRHRHTSVLQVHPKLPRLQRWSIICVVKLFLNPIYETHYNPGVAEQQCNHSLMRLLRSSTRAARASAVRFLFVFRRILQVRVILQVLTHRVPKRT